jgi:hypothetical protein
MWGDLGRLKMGSVHSKEEGHNDVKVTSLQKVKLLVWMLVGHGQIDIGLDDILEFWKKTKTHQLSHYKLLSWSQDI